MNQSLCRIIAALAVLVSAVGCHTLGKQKSTPNNSFNESAGDSWLIQYNSAALGDQRVYVTPHKSKFETKAMGLNIVLLKAPEETVFIFSEPKKLMYNGSIASWKADRERQFAEAESKFTRAVGFRDDTVYEKGNKDETIAGLPTKHYVGTSLTHLKDGTTEEMTTQIWVTDQIKAPPELFTFATGHSKGLPPNAVPMRISVEANGKQQFLMETVKAFKMAVPDSVFEIPLGYKTMGSESELLNTIAKELIEQEEARHPELADIPAKPGAGKPPSAKSAEKDDSKRARRSDGGVHAAATASDAKGEIFGGLAGGGEKKPAKAAAKPSAKPAAKPDEKPAKKPADDKPESSERYRRGR